MAVSLRERHNQLSMRVDEIVRQHQQASGQGPSESLDRVLDLISLVHWARA